MDGIQTKRLENRLRLKEKNREKLVAMIAGMAEAPGAKLQPQLAALDAEIEKLKKDIEVVITAPKVEAPRGSIARPALTPLPKGVWPPEDDKAGMPRLDPRPDLLDDSHLWNELLNMAKPTGVLFTWLFALRRRGGTLYRPAGHYDRWSLWGTATDREELFEPRRAEFEAAGIYWEDFQGNYDGLLPSDSLFN